VHIKRKNELETKNEITCSIYTFKLEASRLNANTILLNKGNGSDELEV
jgi:hypothetical protein